jgi:uncharacterized protein YraI/beta-lactamase class A
MRQRLQRTSIGAALVVAMLVWLALVPVIDARAPSGQGASGPEVYAEALGQANLRGGPGIDYPVVGQIVAGTRYRVLARHTLVPWLRLDYPLPDQGEAWVYADLVTVIGDITLVPAVNDFTPLATATPTCTPTASPVASASATASPAVTPDLSATPTAEPPSPARTVSGPVATTLGEANVRFGPDLTYPVITKVPAGMSYPVLELHALVPWIRIALPESPTGSGWIFRDVVEITGDLSQTPVTNAIQFAYPTVTPTPATLVVNGAPWSGAPVAPGQLAATLGEQMNAYLLSQGFAPYSDQMASVFVMDLQTGDNFTLNDDVAYSGMSLTKIPILAAYFQRHRGSLTYDEAYLVANMMMCSENISTNQVLAQLGDGDPLRGAQRVTAFVQSLNLHGTFIMQQYATLPDEVPVNAGTIMTGMDQTSTRPDAYNQITPRDLGWLLASIYQCAQGETGLLTQTYPNDFTVEECRQMLYAMDSNTIGVFLEAGVPPGTRVIHKHGWISDTHGDAGIVIGPKGAYVFVAVLYSQDWLEFDVSSPIIAELSRMTWNSFNPDTPLAAITPGIVPADCDPRGDPVMQALMSANLPMIGP